MPPPLSILLVEDNRDEVELMCEAFGGTAAHLVVQVADNVRDAWALLAGLPEGDLPLLVITDHHLPDDRGQALIERMHACPVRARVPVVMVSGDAERPPDLSASTLWFSKPDTWGGWRTLASTLVAHIA